MAPEVLRCKAVDGVLVAMVMIIVGLVVLWYLCYEMLVGQPPAGYVDSAEMAMSY